MELVLFGCTWHTSRTSARCAATGALINHPLDPDTYRADQKKNLRVCEIGWSCIQFRGWHTHRVKHLMFVVRNWVNSNCKSCCSNCETRSDTKRGRLGLLLLPEYYTFCFHPEAISLCLGVDGTRKSADLLQNNFVCVYVGAISNCNMLQTTFK